MKNPIEDNVSRKMQQEINTQTEYGKLCRSLGITKGDLFLINDIKKQGKMEEVQYVIDHRLTIEDLEKKEEAKHWDPFQFLAEQGQAADK